MCADVQTLSYLLLELWHCTMRPYLYIPASFRVLFTWHEHFLVKYTLRPKPPPPLRASALLGTLSEILHFDLVNKFKVRKH